LTIHLSTQANTLNKFSAEFWHKQGIKRVILARELTLSEIKEISEFVPDLQLEAFVHGAMCVSYSGRCLLSNYLADRDANRGECVQTCRWKFKLNQITKNGDREVYGEEDERGSYFFNSKDLNMLCGIEDLIKTNICSFKIEGRMKSEFYLATVINAYRRAIDEFVKIGKIVNANIYEK
jgi:putative protease